jgi:hypothetical protein
MKFLPRILSEKITVLATKFPVVSVTGPRQSGKTTLVRQLFPNHTYCNLENPDYRAAARQSPRDFLRQNPRGLIIDEAQYVPELFSYLQIEADEQNQPGMFVLCGSQHFLLMEKISQSLAGRVGIVNLLPFSMEEMAAGEIVPSSVWDLIFKGSFPRLYQMDIEPADFYPAYIQTYIERDARQVVNISNLDAFQAFVRLCAGRVGQLFNQSELGNLVGIDQKTARNWLSILQTGFQAFTLPPYFRNFDKRTVKTPKVYFWDTGVACSLLGIRSSSELLTHFARGHLFENFVVVEMLKSFYHRGIRPNAYFWRDRSGNEIDLLFDEGGILHPIEIKSAQAVKSDFFKGIEVFNAASGNPPERARLIYAGDLSYRHEKAHIHAWNRLPTI